MRVFLYSAVFLYCIYIQNSLAGAPQPDAFPPPEPDHGLYSDIIFCGFLREDFSGVMGCFEVKETSVSDFYRSDKIEKFPIQSGVFYSHKPLSKDTWYGVCVERYEGEICFERHANFFRNPGEAGYKPEERVTYVEVDARYGNPRANSEYH